MDFTLRYVVASCAMHAIRSLRRAVEVVVKTRPLLLGGLGYAAAVAPQTALALLGVPGLTQAARAISFPLTTLVVGGLVGTAVQALAGADSLDTFPRTDANRFLPLLSARLLEFALRVVLGAIAAVVVVLAAAVAGLGSVSATAFLTDAPAAGVLGAVGAAGIAVSVAAVVCLVAFVGTTLMFVQFYPVAVVVDEAGPVSGFARSVGVVRSNLREAAVFSLLLVLVGSLRWLPVGLALLVAPDVVTGGVAPVTLIATIPLPSFAPAPAAALTAVSSLLAILTVPVRWTYATVFYTEAER